MASFPRQNGRTAAALLLCSFALFGCKLDKPASAGANTVAPAPASNHAPIIKGSPATSAKTNQSYVFQPEATDPDGDALTFTIRNKPAWASFDLKTGKLAGTPSSTYTGQFADISIAVSDGKSTSELGAFDITVATTSATGYARLAWQPPTQNVDGTPLTNLAGYVIRYGTGVDKLTQEIRIANPGVTTTLVEDLSAATWHFTVSAYTTTGVESSPSVVASKTVT